MKISKGTTLRITYKIIHEDVEMEYIYCGKLNDKERVLVRNCKNKVVLIVQNDWLKRMSGKDIKFIEPTRKTKSLAKIWLDRAKESKIVFSCYYCKHLNKNKKVKDHNFVHYGCQQQKQIPTGIRKDMLGTDYENKILKSTGCGAYEER